MHHSTLYAVTASLLLAVATTLAADTRLEETALALENDLISPCCWSQPVSIHQSPAAERMRVEIRGLLAQGMSRDQVLEAFVTRYGDRILSAPPARGFFALSYWLPVLVLGVGAAVVGVFYRTHRSPAQPPPQRATVDPVWARRLEEELRR